MAFIGLCQDMCPESERQARFDAYMSIFECNPRTNQPDERAMIKEYRRSGADQEEPSPLDLRTLSALERTMNYLVCNIMDDSRSKSVELAQEWYDFIWDRLRAIRKDITQQNICDPNSATLVEQCVRFHVHCCYAMSRVKDFDVDMNRRNLNDCLQMLRQMYTDLKLSSNSVCPSELEFQKYDILLHLTADHLSSNVLLKTSEHRSKGEMKFVTNIFNAYTNNDYFKYFKLMKQADYMTSCILSLYANQMRLTAIKTIATACRQTTLYPLELVESALGFDNTEDVLAFTSSLQIPLQEKNSNFHLILSRELIAQLLQSKSSLLPFRSNRMVESKMFGKSVGQLIYGGPNIIPDIQTNHTFQVRNQFVESETSNQVTWATGVGGTRAIGKRAPRFPKKLEDTETSAGEAIDIKMKVEDSSVTSYPRLSSKRRHSRTQEDSYRYKRKSQTYELDLTINDIQSDQQAQWEECKAKDEVGESVRGSDLGVFTEPKIITNLPDSLRVSPGKEIRLHVEASGSPEPVYSWYRNGLGIAVEEGRVVTKIKAASNTTKSCRTLIIRSSRPEDAGQYSCKIENSLGQVESRACKLTIIGHGDDPKGAPKIIKDFSSDQVFQLDESETVQHKISAGKRVEKPTATIVRTTTIATGDEPTKTTISGRDSLTKEEEEEQGVVNEAENVVDVWHRRNNRAVKDRDAVAKLMPAGRFKKCHLHQKRPNLKMSSASTPIEAAVPTKRRKARDEKRDSLDSMSLRIDDEENVNKIFAQLVRLITN